MQIKGLFTNSLTPRCTKTTKDQKKCKRENKAFQRTGGYDRSGTLV